MNALNVLYAQLTRDLFAIAKFLLRKHIRLQAYALHLHTSNLNDSDKNAIYNVNRFDHIC